MSEWFRHTWSVNRKGFEGRAAGLYFEFERLDRPRGEDRFTGHVGRDASGLMACGDVFWLAANLAGDHPILAEAREALFELLPEGARALHAANPRLGAHGSRDTSRYYCADPRSFPGRIALALKHPTLACVLPLLDAAARRDGSELPGDGLDILARHAPASHPAMRARILGSGWPVAHVEILDALLALPPDWFPATDGDRDAFESLVMATSQLAHLLGGHGHLAASRGRWSEFAARCGPAEREALRRACEDALDVPRAMAEQVVVPALVWRLGDAAAEDLRSLPERDMWQADTPGAPVRQPRAMHVATRLLYAGKSVPAILDMSRDWHARRQALDAAMARVGLDHPVPPGSARRNAWPVPFGPMEAPNGVSIRFLPDSEALVTEGQSLSHCVGGYSAQCESGASAVASLRLPSSGGDMPLSTLEVAVSGPGRVARRQHRGRRNAEPPRPAMEAVDWFLGEVEAGNLRVGEDYLDRGWRVASRGRDVAATCGYGFRLPGALAAAAAAWSPFLRRPMRDAGALADAAEATLADVPPNEEPPARVMELPPPYGPLARGATVLAMLPLLAGEALANLPLLRRLPGTLVQTLAMVVGLSIQSAAMAGGRYLAGSLLGAGAYVAYQIATVVAHVDPWLGAMRSSVARTARHAWSASAANRSLRRRGLQPGGPWWRRKPWDRRTDG